MILKSEFVSFYEETYQNLYAYLLTLIPNQMLAEDFCQEAFIKFLRKCPDDLKEDMRKNYLFSIARRLVFDYFRQKKLFMRYELKELKKSVQRSYEIESDLLSNSVLEKIMRKLKVKERDMVHLYYKEDLSQKEIATICKMKETSVKVLLKRYRDKMKEIAESMDLTWGDIHD